MCNVVRNMNLKRLNNALKRHLQSSAFLYAIFGSGPICGSSSELMKTTFLLRAIQATLIVKHIQKYILIIALSPKYWQDKLNVWIWFGVVLFHIMKMFAMFINSFREKGLISSVIHDLVKIDRSILEFSTKKARKSWLYSYKLYFLDAIGMSFLGIYHVVKYVKIKDVPGYIDIIFFMKAICILMHSSFCKYVFVTFSLFRNVNEHFCILKEFYLSQNRTTQTIRILTVQHRSIVRVWRKLMQFYESYLFFQVLSIFLDLVYVMKKVFLYMDQSKSGTDLQVWHVFIGAVWSFYEILSICILCTKVAVEGNKTGIIMHDLTTDKSFSYLSSEISYVFEYMERGNLSCSPYGIFTINNRLFFSIVADFFLAFSCLYCISHL